MNKKYQRYINYIVSDIELPYLKYLEQYGLSDNEMEYVLSKVYEQPVSIDGYNVYDTNNNIIYYETSDGSWAKREYDTNGNEIYWETSNGYWVKQEYDTNGNTIYYESGDGDWAKWEYDTNGNEIYYENSNGYIRDNR